jgi:hypothetical protein
MPLNWVSDKKGDGCYTVHPFNHTISLPAHLGYFSFEECGDTVNPTIGMEVGETYTFVQADR